MRLFIAYGTFFIMQACCIRNLLECLTMPVTVFNLYKGMGVCCKSCFLLTGIEITSLLRDSSVWKFWVMTSWKRLQEEILHSLKYHRIEKTTYVNVLNHLHDERANPSPTPEPEIMSLPNVDISDETTSFLDSCTSAKDYRMHFFISCIFKTENLTSTG